MTIGLYERHSRYQVVSGTTDTHDRTMKPWIRPRTVNVHVLCSTSCELQFVVVVCERRFVVEVFLFFIMLTYFHIVEIVIVIDRGVIHIGIFTVEESF